MMRLLCVEDEASLREDIVEYLRMKSYEVDEAQSGEEAIDRLNENHYDLVLCDIKMPRMDGYELLRQIRSENNMSTTPFLFLSALNERDDKIRAHESGCDGYLTKPIDFSVLDATLKSHIDRQRTRDFVHATALECSQRHMMTLIDNALSGPMAESTLIIQHLRDTLPTQTPSALGVHLEQVQDKLNTHANELHAFHSALQMQVGHVNLQYEIIRSSDLVKQAVADCLHHCPSAPIRFSDAKIAPVAVYGDARMLKRCLAGLMAAITQPCSTGDVVDCKLAIGACLISICDDPAMVHESDFTVIDETTNLVALSNATRHRIAALTYALQVANAHNGRLELMLWPEDKLAVRLVLPQLEA